MQKIIDLLGEELYTRPQVSSYTIKTFEEVIHSVDFDAISFEEIPALLKTLQEHIKRIPSSPIALFAMIFLKIRRKLGYIQEVNTLFQILTFAKKQSIVLFLAREFIKKDDSNALLPTLISLIEKNDTVSSQEELQDLYGKILQKSPSDPVVLYKLASIKKKLNKSIESLLYYKAAFSNMINNNGEFQKELIEIWDMLISLQETDFEFFLRSIRVLSKDLSAEKLEYTFKALHGYVMQGDFTEEQRITLVKEMLYRNCPQNWDFRSILIELYKKKYQKNTLLQTFLEISRLFKDGGSLQTNIDSFESLIRFDVGAYVLHKSFGYGKIQKVIVSSKDKDSADFVIDFQKKQGHLMSLRIATTALSVFDSDSFLIQKTFEPTKLQGLFWKNLPKFMESIFQTSRTGLTLLQIKNLICPDMISLEDWPQQSKRVQIYLKDSPHIELRTKTYFWQSDKEDQRAILLQRIENEISIDARLSLMETFSTLYKGTDKEHPIFQQALARDVGHSCCVLFRIAKLREVFFLQGDCEEKKNLSDTSWTDEQIQSGVQKFLGVTRIQFLHSIFVNDVKEKLQQIQQLFYKNCEDNLHIAQSFLEIGNSFCNKNDVLLQNWKEFIQQLYDNYLENSAAFLIFSKFFGEKSLMGFSQISFDTVMLRLVELLGIFHKEMEFFGKQSKARKHYSLVFSMLFDQEKLMNFLHSKESHSVRSSIIKLLDQFYFLENYMKVEIKKLAIEFSIS